jgi:hypothetical protein
MRRMHGLPRSIQSQDHRAPINAPFRAEVADDEHLS